MEINLNFKRVDVNAFTLKEAEEILAEKANFEKFANATQAWKNAGSPMQNTKEFKEFCANYLAEKTKNKQGLGCVIVYEAGKADTRERPWEMNDVVNELGKRKYKTTYLIIDEETGKQKVDKEGNPKEKPVFDISIYSQIDEDGMQLWETFVSGKTVEDVVFQNQGKILSE